MTGRYELGAKKGERNSYGDHPQEHPTKKRIVPRALWQIRFLCRREVIRDFLDKARSAVGRFARVGITKPRFSC